MGFYLLDITGYLFTLPFLLATAFKRDQNHTLAATAMRNMKDSRLVAAPVVVELFFMATARLSYARAVHLMTLLQGDASEIINLTSIDRLRMVELMQQYQDAELDFADTAQIAIAERLNISQIYTFDHRDFGMVRPRHIDYFELLP